MASDISVAFVVGKGRSGSTILGDVLGSVPGVFHAGELWRIWSTGIGQTHSCSCGQSVDECTVWSRVLEHVAATPAGGRAVRDPQRFGDLQTRLFTFGGLARSSLRPGTFRAEAAEARAVMTSMYKAIGTVTTSQLIIDTSKWPLDPMLLRPTAAIRSFGVHLVRDPRDVATSWRRTKYFPDTGEAMPTFGALHTSASWTARNLAAEWTTRRIGNRMLSLKHEDFVASPQVTVDAIVTHAGFEGTASGLFRDGSWIDLAPGHTIMGNPSRFEHGSIQIVPPETSPKANRIVKVLTWPLRRRYGYT